MAGTITVTMLPSTVPWSWASSIPMVCTGVVSFVCEAYACSTDGKEAPLTMDEYTHTSQEVQVIHVGWVSRVLALAKAEGADAAGGRSD